MSVLRGPMDGKCPSSSLRDSYELRMFSEGPLVSQQRGGTSVYFSGEGRRSIVSSFPPSVIVNQMGSVHFVSHYSPITPPESGSVVRRRRWVFYVVTSFSS